MKKKVLLTSVLTIAMCLSLITGVTFALFTSTSAVNVAVTSGTIDIVANINGVTTGYDENIVTSANENFTAEIVGDTLTLENMIPGDTAKVTIAVNNASTVTAKYRTFVELKEDDGLFGGLTLKVDDVETNGFTLVSKWNSIEANAQINDVVIDIALPEVGNEYQNKSCKIAFRVEAVQGNAPTTDNADDEISVYNLSDLQNLSNKTNAGTLASGYTFKLENDLDLAGVNFKAIGTDKAFYGNFDGQNHVISNLTVRGTTEVGLFGSVVGKISNLTIKDAEISGTYNAGVVVGWIVGQIDAVHVENAKVVVTPAIKDGVYDDGNNVGGIVGYLCKDGLSDAFLINSSITNADITAYRKIGGLAGAVNNGAYMKNNVGTNVTLRYSTIADGVEYADGKTNCDMGLAYGWNSAPDLSENNEVTGNMVSDKLKIATVNSVEELDDVLTIAGQAGAGNTNVSLPANSTLDLTSSTWTPIKVDGYHGADIVTIDGNGATITGLTAPLFAGGFAGGSGIVVRNLTIKDSNIVSTNGTGSGAFIESCDSMDTITLENCHLINSTVSGSRTGGLLGWTAGYNNTNDGPVKTYVTIKNCSVIGCTITGSSVGAINGHAGNNAWTYTTIEDCTILDNKLNSTDDGGWRVGVVVGTANVGEVYINRITESGNTLTQTGKTAPAGQSNLYGRFVPVSTGKLFIDGVEILA